MSAYRPRLPEIVAMLDAMPADVETLTQVSGRPAAWAQRMLSRMVCERIIQQRHDVYSESARSSRPTRCRYSTRCELGR